MDKKNRRLERRAAIGDLDAIRILELKKLRSEHKPECSILTDWDQYIAQTDLFNHEVSEYMAKWPNYCETCLGWGGKWGYDSDTGASDFDPCTKCIAIGTCPRCGEKQAVNLIGEGYYDHFACSKCNWDDEQEEKRAGILEPPEPAQCDCWSIEDLDAQYRRNSDKDWRSIERRHFAEPGDSANVERLSRANARRGLCPCGNEPTSLFSGTCVKCGVGICKNHSTRCPEYDNEECPALWCPNCRWKRAECSFCNHTLCDYEGHIAGTRADGSLMNPDSPHVPENCQGCGTVTCGSSEIKTTGTFAGRPAGMFRYSCMRTCVICDGRFCRNCRSCDGYHHEVPNDVCHKCMRSCSCDRCTKRWRRFGPRLGRYCPECYNHHVLYEGA